jgi:hypothetical protein
MLDAIAVEGLSLGFSAQELIDALRQKLASLADSSRRASS